MVLVWLVACGLGPEGVAALEPTSSADDAGRGPDEANGNRPVLTDRSHGPGADAPAGDVPLGGSEGEGVSAGGASPEGHALPDGVFSRELSPGLVLSAFLPPDVADPGYHRAPADLATDPRIFVVTIDPEHFEIVARSVLDPAVGGRRRTADQWAADEGLVVAWNPGMFEPDGRATGYARYGSFTSQPEVRRNGLYASFFVVGSDGSAAVHRLVPPKGAGVYAARSEVPALAVWDGAALVAQSLTVLRDGRAAWPPRKNQWSELAYGVDRQGRVAVVFTRWPYEMRELGARLEALDLGLDALIHGEGGPEASLVVRAGGVSLDLMGSYETGFYDDRNRDLWSLPAIMGARPR